MGEKRRKIWIDRFQTYLSFRIALYFVLYQVGVWAVVSILLNLHDAVGTLGQPLAPFANIVTWVIPLLLGTVFICDSVRLTHRIVGPLYRFRKTIQAITNGQEVDLIHLRQGDFLTDLKDELNEMLKVLEQRGAVVLKRTPAQQQKQSLPV